MYRLKLLITILMCFLLVGCQKDESGSIQGALKYPQMDANRVRPQPQEDIFAQQQEEQVVINTNNVGRSDPFKPYYEKSLTVNSSYRRIMRSQIQGQVQGKPDPALLALRQIRVNGILFDYKRPSAILSFEDSDYVVHKGDMFFSYFIKDINNDKVIIQYKKSTYSAGIGKIIYNNNDSNNKAKSGQSSLPSNNEAVSIRRRQEVITSVPQKNSLPEIRISPPSNYLSPVK